MLRLQSVSWILSLVLNGVMLRLTRTRGGSTCRPYAGKEGGVPSRSASAA